MANGSNAVRLLITVAITLLSYYLIEQPVLRGVLKPRPALIALPVSIVLVLGVILVGTAAGEPTPSALERIDRGFGPCGAPLPEEVAAARSKFAEIGFPPPDPRADGLRLLMVGDSRACALLTGLEVLGKEQGATVANAAVLGCGIVADAVGKSLSIVPREEAEACHQRVRDAQGAALESGRPDVILWWSGWEVANLEVDGQEIQFGTAESDAVLLERMDAMFERLHTGNEKFLILTDPPVLPTPYFPDPHPAQDAQHGHLNDLYRQFAARHPGDIAVADLSELLCPGLVCPKIVDGFEPRPFDGMHLSQAGAAWATKWLWPQVLALAPAP